jgi:hypothetical protein
MPNSSNPAGPKKKPLLYLQLPAMVPLLKLAALFIIGLF